MRNYETVKLRTCKVWNEIVKANIYIKIMVENWCCALTLFSWQQNVFKFYSHILYVIMFALLDFSFYKRLDRIWFRLCLSVQVSAHHGFQALQTVADINSHRHLPWPVRHSSSQTVNIRRKQILLCWTFSLEHSSWHLKKYTFSVYFWMTA